MNKKLILVAVLFTATAVFTPTANADAKMLNILDIAWNINPNKKASVAETPVEETQNQTLASVGTPSTFKVLSSGYGSVSAYNVGIVWQNDNTPCTGAYHKVDLCEEVASGRKVCAANFVPLHSTLRIHTGENDSFDCIVWDRMNSRYNNTRNVDIAMNADEIQKAREFGRRTLLVEVIETN